MKFTPIYFVNTIHYNYSKINQFLHLQFIGLSNIGYFNGIIQVYLTHTYDRTNVQNVGVTYQAFHMIQHLGQQMGRNWHAVFSSRLALHKLNRFAVDSRPLNQRLFSWSSQFQWGLSNHSSREGLQHSPSFRQDRRRY